MNQPLPGSVLHPVVLPALRGLAALAMIIPCDADITDPSIPKVIHQPQHLRGDFDDNRTLLGIDLNEVVDRVVIGGKLDGA